MRSSLMSHWDAVAYTASGDRTSDMFWTWAFADGQSPVAESDVIAHLVSRQPFVEALQRRYVELPGNVDRPYWVADDTPIANRIHRFPGAITAWDAYLDAVIDEYVNHPVDPRVTAWKLHISYGISGVPGADGTATVITLQICHALITGVSMATVSAALFGDPATPVALPGQPRVHDKKLGPLRTAQYALAAPVKAVHGSLRWLLRRSRAQFVRVDDRLPVAMSTSLNWPASAARAIRILRYDLSEIRSTPLTTTVVGLVAASRAIERYLDQRGEPVPRPLVALVPVIVDDIHGVMGVNRLYSARVGLYPELPGLLDRAKAIADDLIYERERASSAELTALRKLVPMQSWLLYHHAAKARAKKPGQDRARPVLIHTLATSIPAGAGPFTLAGREAVISGLISFAGGETAFGHSFNGAGDVLTVVITMHPDDDIDGYAHLFDGAVAEVIATARDSS